MPKFPMLALLLSSLLFLTIFGGCSDDPTIPEDDFTPPPELGGITPEILMSNFKMVYEDMRADDFESILHQDYRMVLLQSTIDDWAQGNNPLEEMFFDHDLQVHIHRNIFEGLGGENEVGNTIPPIDSISISLMDKIDPWELVDDEEPYFSGRGAYVAPYRILMHFNKPDGSRYEVDQVIRFFVIQNENELWYLLGTHGNNYYAQNTPAKSTANVSWGGVLSMYR